jgi:hypothetical protein
MAISDQVRAPQGPADKKAKAWYALPGDEVAAKLGVDLGSGLSAAKAAARLRRDGPNALPGSSRRQLCAGKAEFQHDGGERSSHRHLAGRWSWVCLRQGHEPR